MFAAESVRRTFIDVEDDRTKVARLAFIKRFKTGPEKAITRLVNYVLLPRKDTELSTTLTLITKVKKFNKTEFIDPPPLDPANTKRTTLTAFKTGVRVLGPSSRRKKSLSILPLTLFTVTTYVATVAFMPVFTTMFIDRRRATTFEPIKFIITMAAVDEDRTIVAIVKFKKKFSTGAESTAVRTRRSPLFVAPRKDPFTQLTLKRNRVRFLKRATTRNTQNATQHLFTSL